MPVRIRLRRIGRKKQPYYRLVVAEKHSPRDGAYIDQVGYYNPRSQPAELQIDLAKVDEWLARGAELSESAASLVKKARRGGDAKVALREAGKQAAPAVAAAPAPAPAKKAAAEPVEAASAAPEPEAAEPVEAAGGEAAEAAAPEEPEAGA